jgi:hypothetical protein
MNTNYRPVEEDPMNETQRPPQSQLFTLRVWQADSGESQMEWRGKLQHVVSGQTQYFRDWPTLILHLGEMLSEPTGGIHTPVDGD